MLALVVVSSSLPPSLRCRPLRPQPSHPQTHHSNSSSFLAKLFLIRNRFATVKGSRTNDPKEPPFMDDNGAVDDMDGYMNYLSLEYDSVWDTKPSWCQPWTIALTGVLAIGFSWLISHSVPVTTVVLCLISAWWYIFLYSYPKAYSNMIADRRKKVTDGVEDTFGVGSD